MPHFLQKGPSGRYIFINWKTAPQGIVKESNNLGITAKKSRSSKCEMGVATKYTENWREDRLRSWVLRESKSKS
jgi:hypothetical protein